MRAALLLAVAACSGSTRVRPPPPPPPGPALSQADLERMLVETPSSAGVRATIAATSTETCMAGTAGDAAVASYLASTLRSLGFVVEIKSYDVYLPHPRKLAVKVNAAKPFELSLVEPLAKTPLPEAMTWNAYSANGTVTAPLVDAGTASDADLAKIDVKGKVALVRYGALYRGAQVAAAERHGAAAVIFVSDGNVQRGTVVYYWQAMGDPRGELLPKIPVLNVGASEAAKLTPLADGKTTVEVTVELDGKRRTIRDVIATLPGRSPELVMLGNHYDGWVYGALDPHSGTATLVEIAKGLGKLAKTGWKPARTIAIGFWDAEEFGVIGSSMYVMSERARLQRDVVAYFNIDTIRAGSLVLQGAPELRAFLTACSAPLQPTFKDIGIGSDWTAFLHHAGITSVQWQTGPGQGVYKAWHSGLDDIEHAEHESDPGFQFIPTFAQALGTCALRLATAETLPFDWTATATWIRSALDELAKTKAFDRTRLDAALAAFEAAGNGAHCSELPHVERDFIVEDGLADRSWYKNVITGPNPDNGYGALLLPELAAARDGAATERAIGRIVTALERATARLQHCH